MNIVDMGVSQLGAIHVPVYPTLSTSDHEFIFDHAEIKYVFVSDKLLLNKLKLSIEKSKYVKAIYCFNEVEGEKNWMDIVTLGDEKRADFLVDLKKCQGFG